MRRKLEWFALDGCFFLTLTHCGSLVHRPAMAVVDGLARQSNRIIAREERDGVEDVRFREAGHLESEAMSLSRLLSAASFAALGAPVVIADLRRRKVVP